MSPLLSVQGLVKTWPGPRRVRALDDLSFTLEAGQTLGIVGPSGSGKSTLARVLERLEPADAGRVQFDGLDWLALRGAALRRQRGRMQMVFQDPLAAFHPRATVYSALTDPLRIHGLAPPRDWPREVARMLEEVQLSPELARRPVTAISGGQRQRVAIARALAPRPKLLILDEAVSALDVSVRGHILDLLVRLQRRHGTAFIFISHDLAVVKAVSHRVTVMDAGRIIEEGPAEALIAQPQTPLLRALIAASPALPV